MKETAVPRDPNRAAALHEAAHALAAAAVGFEVRELWVDAGGGYCGYRRPHGRTWEEVVVTLAGWIADSIYGGNTHLIAEREDEIRAMVLDESKLLEAEENAELSAEVGDGLAAARILLGELDNESDQLETLDEAGREAQLIVRDGWATLEQLTDLLLAAQPRTTPTGALELLNARP